MLTRRESILKTLNHWLRILASRWKNIWLARRGCMITCLLYGREKRASTSRMCYSLWLIHMKCLSQPYLLCQKTTRPPGRSVLSSEVLRWFATVRLSYKSLACEYLRLRRFYRKHRGLSILVSSTTLENNSSARDG